jgi:hypothetical protein
VAVRFEAGDECEVGVDAVEFDAFHHLLCTVGATRTQSVNSIPERQTVTSNTTPTTWERLALFHIQLPP